MAEFISQLIDEQPLSDAQCRQHAAANDLAVLHRVMNAKEQHQSNKERDNDFAYDNFHFYIVLVVKRDLTQYLFVHGEWQRLSGLISKYGHIALIERQHINGQIILLYPIYG